LRQNPMRRVFTGAGILGWIATHVHRELVVTQLHIIPKSVLQLSISLHAEEVVDSSTAAAGRALVESKWTKRRSMVHD
jgi:hypothetical protein